jgi:predicted ChrR family anti-sigma factor
MKHPSMNEIRNYALGTQDITMRLLVESHLDHCSGCEQKVKQIREESLATPSDDDYIPPPQSPELSGIFDSILSSLPEPVEEDTALFKHSLDMEALPDFLKSEILPEEEWKWVTMWPAQGKIGTIYEDEVGGYSLYLAYFKAGEKAPKHKHLDDEYTVMLKGGYSYDNTHIGVGDWDHAAPGSVHGPEVDADQDCWCVVRSKTKKSVAFKGTAAWRTPFVKLSELRS